MMILLFLSSLLHLLIEILLYKRAFSSYTLIYSITYITMDSWMFILLIIKYYFIIYFHVQIVTEVAIEYSCKLAPVSFQHAYLI